MSLYFSKSDEKSPESSLSHVLPSHEYFHFLMCVADLESGLFRECSRGLDGGAFTTATLLHRNKAKLSKGKDAIDALKDFITIKAEARFVQYFLAKYALDPSVDNTPPSLRTAPASKKEAYLHEKVQEALRDLLPQFRECTGVLPNMDNFPFQEQSSSTATKLSSGSEYTDDRLLIHDPAKYIHDQEKQIRNKKKNEFYVCKLCGFESKLKSVSIAHLQECCKAHTSLTISQQRRGIVDSDDVNQGSASKTENDYFWNYKSGEFYLDSLFKLMLNFEKHGHGIGMFIVSKLLLPFLHSLGHSNYTNTIHRFISRVLTSVTPREAMMLIWERFCNRTGQPGGNIFKDRRIEFRIRTVAIMNMFTLCHSQIEFEFYSHQLNSTKLK